MPKSPLHESHASKNKNEKQVTKNPLLRLTELLINIDKREHVINREQLAEEGLI